MSDIDSRCPNCGISSSAIKFRYGEAPEFRCEACEYEWRMVIVPVGEIAMTDKDCVSEVLG